MKYAVVYSSSTGNTEKLAQAIKGRVGDCYFGKPSDEALEADVIFIGFWAIGSACGADIKKFMEQLSDKKVFLFGTAGYGTTPEFFTSILNNVTPLLPETNTLIGSYMCQGKVAEAIVERMKENKPEKYEAIQDALVESVNHPNEQDIALLQVELDKVLA